ncbi:sensor histidine kinase [Lactococcus laudensis]|uniref:sensor histidine kinase n=1 Tax=Pseudolactococcus laudensis TaxID=1494461 RepID=UPI0002774BF6|nr:sensor histidine kinase (homolog to ciaH Spn),truncated [Lactococcus raffinolactis 4877]
MKKIVKKFASHHLFRFDVKHFLHFFVVFTVIFVALSVIILQTLTLGIYKSTDETIERLAKNPLMLTNLALHGTNNTTIFSDGPVNSQSNETSSVSGTQISVFSPNQTVILYDKKGQILNADTNLETSTVAEDIKFDKSNVGKISTVTIKTSGDALLYRTKTFKVTFDKNITTNIAYIQIFVNVDQLSDSLSRSQFIILTTMVSFWLISLVASIYLSRWSQKPVLAAYEKEKNFVENASHELRTPLAILQNRLELLFQKPTATIIDQSENISQSLAEVRNMRMLTSNLLNLAKRDGGLKVELTTVDQTYFEKIFENYKLLAENSEREFTSSVHLKDRVKLDESLIKQVLTILFDNAVKYTDVGSQIDIKVEKTGQNLVITTSDTGYGISNEDKKKIFDRFYRVDKARTRQKGGFGLGLSLAKQIIDACGGRIDVQDNQPQGTKFIIKLRA